MVTPNNYEMAELIFPRLVQLDDHLNVERWGASGVNISLDGRDYTFILRRGMTWSNGVPITASDFAFAINRALDPCTQTFTGVPNYLYPIADAHTFNTEPCTNGRPAGAISTLMGRSLQVTDPQTLIIHLHDPASYFLEALTFPTSWAPPRWLVSQYGADWTAHLADGDGLGGDLFKVVSWQPVKKLVLRRNEHFWGTRARLREIDFAVPPEGSTSYEAYLEGLRDVSDVPDEAYASARHRPDFHEVPSLEIFSLALNWASPPFNDERMRQAFALALNKVQLVRDDTGNIGLPTNHLVPQGMPGYFADLTGPDNTMGLTGNMARASALAQAYANDSCDGDFRRCPPVTFGLELVPKDDSTLATEVRNMWLQAMPGYRITIKLLPYDDLIQQEGAGMFQIFRYGWAGDYPDPQDWLSLQLLPNSPFNLGQVGLDEADTLMHQADVDQDSARRLSEYNQAEQLLVMAVARIPISQSKVFYVARSYVVNYQQTADLMPTSDTWQRVYIARHTTVATNSTPP